MKMKTLIAVAVAGAFALPFAAQASADHDSMILAQSGSAGGGAAGGAPGTPGGAAGTTGGAAGASGASDSPSTNAPGGTSPASGATSPTATDMTVLDKNGDGYVSRDEATDDPSMQTRFSELDTDNDGRISKNEWDAGTDSSAAGSTTK